MRKILILSEKGVEDSEFVYPYYRFQEAGFKMDIVPPKAKEQYIGKIGGHLTEFFPDQVNLDIYEAVIIPGGQAPDKMRLHADMVDIVREANVSGKIIAAICHGPQMLIEADVVRGKTATSWPSVRTDLKNAGAKVVDEAAVIDGNTLSKAIPNAEFRTIEGQTHAVSYEVIAPS